MLKRAMFLVIAAMALMALAAGPVRAQFGAIEGNLKDENGKPMAGTRIVIQRIDIKGNYEVKEKDTKKGHYYHGGLPLGRYTVLWMQGEQTLDKVDNVKVSLGDPQDVSFDLKAVKDRQLAAQAGITQPQGAGPGAPQLSKEQREKIQEAIKQREAQKQKQEKLLNSFNVGREALTAARDQAAMIAKAGITAPAGTALTPEMRATLDATKLSTVEEAIKQFQAAGEADPTQHAVFGYLADAYVELARMKRGEEQQTAFKNAFDAYGKAIALKPDDATYHMNLGSALANAGQMDKANEELGKAAQLDPKAAPMAFFNLGVILVNSGKMKEAQVPLKKSVEADPNYADSWYWLGMSLSGDAQVDVKTGKVTPAAGTMEAFQKYLDLQPNGKYATEAKAAMSALGGTVQTEIKSEKARGRKKN